MSSVIVSIYMCTNICTICAYCVAATEVEPDYEGIFLKLQFKSEAYFEFRAFFFFLLVVVVVLPILTDGKKKKPSSKRYRYRRSP